jgi:hypothetical protein
LCNWIVPKTYSVEEEEAAERARQMHVSTCGVWNSCHSHWGKNTNWGCQCSRCSRQWLWNLTISWRCDAM